MSNNKISCRRFDIFLAHLDGIKPHYVCCISSWKSNSKSSSINACIISSKINKHPCHILIRENFLEMESQIECETILTLNKEKLIKKVGSITDLFTQLEIEKALESQLQLSKDFINLDIQKMENYLQEGISTMNNTSVLETLKTNICASATDNKNLECIEECNKLIALTKEPSLLWHSYYHKSLMLTRLGNYEEALFNARESLKFVGSLRCGINNLYSYSMWLIGYCYELIGDKISSINAYKNLSKYYKKIGKTNMRIDMLFNISRLQNKKITMQKLISIVEKMDFREFSNNKNKETLIKQMENDLTNMQIS